MPEGVTCYTHVRSHALNCKSGMVGFASNAQLLFSLQNFNVKNVCQHGISNLSDLLTVSVSYVLGDSSAGNDDDVGDEKLNIVVKLLPHDPFGRYFVTINQFDLREIQFYTKVCVLCMRCVCRAARIHRTILRCTALSQPYH